MPLFRYRTGAIILACMLPCAAEARQLCGRDVVPFAEMIAGLRAQPGTQVTRETASLIELQDPSS